MARGNAARHLAQLARSRAAALGLDGSSRSISTVGKALPPAADAEPLAASAGSFSQKRHRALAARVQVETQTTSAVPEISIDLFGAVSAVSAEEVQQGVFKNVDGHRFEDGRYKAFTEEISQFIPEERQFTDAVRTFAYGTDASFYRLNPKMVVKVHNEAEIKRVLPIAKRLGVPVTFRAAGTSLSGQAITDSVLLKLSHTGKNFRNFTVHVSGQVAAGTSRLLLRRHGRAAGSDGAAGAAPRAVCLAWAGRRCAQLAQWPGAAGSIFGRWAGSWPTPAPAPALAPTLGWAPCLAPPPRLTPTTRPAHPVRRVTAARSRWSLA
jgi:hypothetical protein